MRGKNRNSIARYLKLPQFTTMNVIDGQAGLVISSSLIFYSLTIYNILNIIVLLILAGVTIATLTGNNGILGQAQKASEVTDIAEVEELLQLEYANIMLEKLANNQDTTNELAMLGSAITSYNTLYPTKAPITPKQISGQIVVNNVTLDKQNLQIGVDTTTDAGHKGEITVAVNYEQGGGQTYVAEIQGKEYEVTVSNHKVSIAKTPIVTTNGGQLQLEVIQ